MIASYKNDRLLNEASRLFDLALRFNGYFNDAFFEFFPTNKTVQLYFTSLGHKAHMIKNYSSKILYFAE
ncbi:hypothetical protein SDC9_73580 [bioreactor metagenome]|uniref:Uncharacterized protein n=1 Tax=bioreactor metagenome TaxID=1076179 RepID=A0A644YES1_9ZZZZ